MNTKDSEVQTEVKCSIEYDPQPKQAATLKFETLNAQEKEHVNRMSASPERKLCDEPILEEWILSVKMAYKFNLLSKEYIRFMEISKGWSWDLTEKEKKELIDGVESVGFIRVD